MAGITIEGEGEVREGEEERRVREFNLQLTFLCQRDTVVLQKHNLQNISDTVIFVHH